MSHTKYLQLIVLNQDLLFLVTREPQCPSMEESAPALQSEGLTSVRGDLQSSHTHPGRRASGELPG